MGKILKYTVEQPCFVGGEHKEVGDIVSLDETEGGYLVSIGRLSTGENPKTTGKAGKTPAKQGEGAKS
jgi:hypothetical protein